MKGNELTGHSGNDEIGTPRWLFNSLDRRFQFTYDAAASHENALCDTYSTVEGTFRKWRADEDPRLWNPQEIDALDGLRQEWFERRAFVNPPYSQPLMGQFIEKAIEERNDAQIIVMLVKYDPSTKNGRLLQSHFHLEYLPRIKYDGMKNAATFASVVAIVKPDMVKP